MPYSKKAPTKKAPVKKAPVKKAPVKKASTRKKSSDTYTYEPASESGRMSKTSAKVRSRKEVESAGQPTNSSMGFRAQQRANMYGNAFTAVTGKKATTKNTNKANPVQQAAIEAILRRAESSATNKGVSASYARSKQGKESAAAMKSARASAKRAAKKK
jgi:hypothetical protein